jgi:hypothetical protein
MVRRFAFHPGTSQAATPSPRLIEIMFEKPLLHSLKRPIKLWRQQ